MSQASRSGLRPVEAGLGEDSSLVRLMVTAAILIASIWFYLRSVRQGESYQRQRRVRRLIDDI